MRLWPFKKKQELPKLIKLTPERVRKILLAGRQPCSNKDCICHDCPSRGMCGFETDMYKSGACFVDHPLSPRTRDCTWKKALKGEYNEKEKGIAEPGRIIPCDSIDGGDFFGFGEIPTERGGDE